MRNLGGLQKVGCLALPTLIASIWQTSNLSASVVMANATFGYARSLHLLALAVSRVDDKAARGFNPMLHPTLFAFPALKLDESSDTQPETAVVLKVKPCRTEDEAIN